MPSNKDLKREEVRGVFVIGILTIIFGFRQFYEMPLWLDAVSNLILPFWSMYVFLMAIGISNDILKEKNCKTCREYARFFFGVGFLFSFGIVILYIITSVSAVIQSLPGIYSSLAIVGLLLLVLWIYVRRRLKTQ